jgi:hypothetical protein
MATSKTKADNFIREMQKKEKELREQFGIDRDDVTVSITVIIQEQVRYSSREDED